jgi:hypothetical protein
MGLRKIVMTISLILANPGRGGMDLLNNVLGMISPDAPDCILLLGSFVFF